MPFILSCASTISKAKGLVLRVAGVMHVLFHLGSAGSIPNEITEEAMRAAKDYVEVCCKHAAFLAGRGDIDEAIQELLKGGLLMNMLTVLTAG